MRQVVEDRSGVGRHGASRRWCWRSSRGKTTVVEASRQFDIPPSEIESWVEDGKRGMENGPWAKPEDVCEQYERQLKDLQDAYGEAMLELRARKGLASPLGKDET